MFCICVCVREYNEKILVCFQICVTHAMPTSASLVLFILANMDRIDYRQVYGTIFDRLVLWSMLFSFIDKYWFCKTKRRRRSLYY